MAKHKKMMVSSRLKDLGKWCKTWGTLIVAIIALGLSGYALFLDNTHFKESIKQSQSTIELEQKHYEELTKPHTKHEEVYDKLVRLDAEVKNAEERIQIWKYSGNDTADFEYHLRNAKEQDTNATIAWNNSNYNEADMLIEKAYNSLGEIPLPTIPVTGSIDASNIITSTGVFKQSITVQSSNGNVYISIPSGTTGKTATSLPLNTIMVAPVTTPIAPPPAGSNIVGIAYDFGPTGATFSPPISMTFRYDPVKFPGIPETSLVVVFYDTTAGRWTTITGAVFNTSVNTVTVPVSHFTQFAVMAPTPTPTPSPVSWWLIAGIAIGVIIAIAVILIIVKRWNVLEE